MIDKIAIHTKEFKVKDGTPLNLEQGTIDYKTGEIKEYELFYDDSNKLIKGLKAWYNSELYKLDINMNGLKVSFNPNKIYYSNNYFSVKESEFFETLNTVQDDLKKNGFLLNIDDSNLSRIDIVKQVRCDNPFIYYTPVYRMLRAKRMQKKDYGSTFNYGNKSREIDFYDKIKQLIDVYKFKDKDFNDLGIDRNENKTRCELREKKPKPLQRDFDIKTLSDLYQPGSFEYLEKRYKSIISEVVFKKGLDKGQLKLDFMSDMKLLNTYKNEFSAGDAIKYFIILQFGGLDELIKKYGSIEIFKDMLEKAGFDRTTVWRNFNRIEKAVSLNTKHYRDSKNIHTIPVLYSELYDKLMAA